MGRRIEETHRRLFVAAFKGRDRKAVLDRLRSAGYDVIEGEEPNSIVSEVNAAAPDLIVLDHTEKDIQAANCEEKLASDQHTRKIPVLVICGPDEKRRVETEPTGIDHLYRPFSSSELLRRIKADIRVAYDEAEGGKRPKRDGVTKLYNRFYFDERMEKEIERARRYSRELSLVFLDIDGLDNINKSFGHETGDLALRSLADILLAGTRLSDITCRFGGDEFALILPETTGADAGILAERLRLLFSGQVLKSRAGDVVVTASCGVAEYPDHGGDAVTIVRMADSAMCRARKEGRNRTVVAFSDAGEPSWGGAAAGPTILLVEGNAYNRSVASVVLRANGYEVIEAGDGTTALALAKSSHPDLVIMDLGLSGLSGLSGLDATRQLYAMEETKDIPVVALTSSETPLDIEELVKAGCRGYITKPIDTNSLASQIEPYIEH